MNKRKRKELIKKMKNRVSETEGTYLMLQHFRPDIEGILKNLGKALKKGQFCEARGHITEIEIYLRNESIISLERALHRP